MVRKKIYILFFILIMIMPLCSRKMNKKAMEIVDKLTIDEKIGQLLLVGVPGKALSDMSKTIMKKYLPGGIILYGYNLSGGNEIRGFIGDLQDVSMEFSGIPLFVSIDQEGGRVKRITDEITQFPGNMAFGIVDDESLIYNAARILGIQLRLLGFNMNLTPVLDVNNNPFNPVINTRSFGSSTEVVSRMGVSYIKGLQESRCIAVGKHFPGHGDTDKDSHVTLPEISHQIGRLKAIEFPSFIESIDAGLESIMTAHIAFPNILQNNLPATISKKFLSDILRKDMRFDGLVITDDMEMKAISRLMDIGDSAVRSIEAGADVILISTHGKSIEKIFKSIKNALKIGVITEERINISVRRIIELKLRYRIMRIEDEKIRYVKIKYNKDEMEILSRADEINRIVSKNAIYFYKNQEDFIHPSSEGVRFIFITSNNCMKGEVKRGFKDCMIYNNEDKFFRSIRKNVEGKKALISDGKTLIVYYHVEGAKPQLIRELIKFTTKRGIKLFLISTGNPFPLVNIESLPSTYFSFSDTVKSIRQSVLCLKGEFKPRRKINVNLGFKNEKE